MLEMANHVLVQMKVHDWTFKKTRHNSFWRIFTDECSLGAKQSGAYYIGYHTLP
jgi:hypothetical protein